MGNIPLIRGVSNRSSRESSRPATPFEGKRYWNYPPPDLTTGLVSGPQGAVLFADGSAYYGPLKDSQSYGFGVWIAPDGTEVEGTWSNDRLEGEAMVVKPDGSRWLSQFRSGSLISEEKVDVVIPGRIPVVRSGQFSSGSMSPGSLTPPSGCSEDVHKFLSDIHLTQYESRFRSQRLSEAGDFDKWSRSELQEKLDFSSMPFGHKTRLLRAITPPPQYASTSSSARVYVPRPPSRPETWLISTAQLEIEQKLSRPAKQSCPGCSVVHKANWLGKEVAVRTFFVKENHESETFELLSRMARIRHPNISLFMAACVDKPGYLSIVTEYVVNGSLDQLLGSQLGVSKKLKDIRAAELTTQNILHLAEGIAVGCAYLRKQGFAHKNLKPSNVLIDAAIDVKLTDYFVKEFSELYHPLPCSADSTVAYVAPEALRLTPFVPYGIDSASDVYSFGMILWQMVSGRKPFVGLTRAHIRVLVGYGGYREQPVQLSTLRGIRHLINRATAHEPAKRVTFERLVVALNSMHSSANSAAEDALITFISGRH